MAPINIPSSGCTAVNLFILKDIFVISNVCVSLGENFNNDNFF